MGAGVTGGGRRACHSEEGTGEAQAVGGRKAELERHGLGIFSSFIRGACHSIRFYFEYLSWPLGKVFISALMLMKEDIFRGALGITSSC